MGDTCDIITKAQGITLNQFLAWNPSAGSSCTGLWADAYACVSIIGHEPSVPATTTTAGNGIATPSPIQPNMVANCDSFYKVKSGDTCDIIASKNSVTSAQIISWNPSVGSGCTTLWLDYVSFVFTPRFLVSPLLDVVSGCCRLQIIDKLCFSKQNICVSIIGHTPTTTKPGNAISTPVPIQAGMTTSCKAFHYVNSGETCEAIAAKYKITLANFVKWNPAVGGTACRGIWAQTYACVAVI